jgi:hypothetical protein
VFYKDTTKRGHEDKKPGTSWTKNSNKVSSLVQQAPRPRGRDSGCSESMGRAQEENTIQIKDGESYQLGIMRSVPNAISWTRERQGTREDGVGSCVV